MPRPGLPEFGAIFFWGICRSLRVCLRVVVAHPGSLSGLGEGWRAEGVWDSELEVVSAGPGRDPWGGGRGVAEGRTPPDEQQGQ